MIQKPDPDYAFLKNPISERVLIPIMPNGNTRANRELIATIPVTIKYIFNRYGAHPQFPVNFKAEILGDILLPEVHHLHDHLKSHQLDILTDVFWRKGFSLGEFSESNRRIIGMSKMRRENFYCPREDVMAPMGSIIDSDAIDLLPHAPKQLMFDLSH